MSASSSRRRAVALEFRRVELEDVPWSTLDGYRDRTVYQSAEWLRFLAETQQATPVVAEITSGDTRHGYLTGLTFTRYGIRLFGSPFTGWTTMAMGFNLDSDLPRWQALEQASRWVHRTLRCPYFELRDFSLTIEDGQRAGLGHRILPTYITDLTKPEDELFAAMTSSYRGAIRKAGKSGVTVEECPPDGSFEEEYYDQLRVVFEKQGLVPTYGVDRVRSLIRHLHPTGKLLLLRARDPDGRSLATNIGVGMNGRAQFWGGASYAFGLPLRPNQALHWHAIRTWKARGFTLFDWGGGGTYKEQFGCTPVPIPGFYSSRFPGLELLRSGAQMAVSQRQHLAGARSRIRNARG